MKTGYSAHLKFEHWKGYDGRVPVAWWPHSLTNLCTPASVGDCVSKNKVEISEIAQSATVFASKCDGLS